MSRRDEDSLLDYTISGLILTVITVLMGLGLYTRGLQGASWFSIGLCCLLVVVWVLWAACIYQTRCELKKVKVDELPPLCCRHKYVDSFGSIGDAVVCVKCNHSFYPSLGNPMFTIKNDGTYGHKDHFPFVVRFAQQITFHTDWDSYTHYFNKKGKLVPREK